MPDVRSLLILAAVPRIGPLKIRALISHFGSAGAVLSAAPRDLIHVPGVDRKLASNIVHRTDGERFADDQLRRLNRIGGRIVTIWDQEYPPLLKRIYDPPPLLFVQGILSNDDRRSIALVGTRRPTPYGQRVAESLSAELVDAGLPVISGLARGIDTLVHTTVIRTGGRTVAIIGSGLDVFYPPENRKLAEKIGGHGAVVSEFPMGTKPDAPNFPRRNRLISGWSLGTVVIESGVDGGAMITATTALDQNREVFAIPGSIFEKSWGGTNKLIRDGRAKLVTNVEDILCELSLVARPETAKRPPPVRTIELSLFEQRIMECIGTDPVHIDAVTEAAATTTSDALVTLLGLEFKGVVRQLPGKHFVRT